jgi:arginase family enzyme
MIKKIESYPELADPQLQPRYSGIPTFFRLPHIVRLDEVDIGLVGVPVASPTAPARATARARSAINRRLSARQSRQARDRPSKPRQNRGPLAFITTGSWGA